MIKLFLIFMTLLPWGNFIFRQADIWHSAGHFVQVGILTLFCYSFFEQPRQLRVMNKPLGVFTLWAGLVTAYGWISVFVASNHYPIRIFMPFFNLLCIVILYKLIVSYLCKVSIDKILNWLKYSVILLLIYCVMQYLKLDEFFAGINNTGDQLVGTIGNTMHLAGLLAILQPLFFKKSLENTLSLVLLWLLILTTGSATGLVAGIAVVLFWLWFKNRRVAVAFSVLSLVSIILMRLLNSQFFHNSDRFKIWGEAFNIAKLKFITGMGLGTVALSNFGTNIRWQHLHNEYYQVVFELGIIGLILALWCIKDYFRVFNSIKTELTIRLASMFFGYCLLCGVTFFSHLWLTSVLGIFAFASVYAIKNEEIDNAKNPS